jgi:hypothetical protein
VLPTAEEPKEEKPAEKPAEDDQPKSFAKLPVRRRRSG